MNKSVAILGVVLLALFTAYFVTDAPKMITPKREAGPVTSGPVAVVGATGSADTKDSTASETQRKTEELHARFEDLKAARKELRSRADLLKSRIWDLKLPRDKAKTVSYALHQAYAYLKNPPMLGAYHDVNQIQRETKKINAMLESLVDANRIVEQDKSQGDAS